MLSLTTSLLKLTGHCMSHALAEASLLEEGGCFIMAEANPNPAGCQSMLVLTAAGSVVRQWSGPRN